MRDNAGLDGRKMRDQAERKVVKGLSLVGHEEVPCGFGLRTRDPGDTADGAGDCRRSAQLSTDYWEEPEVYPRYRLLFLFPGYGTHDWLDLAKVGKAGLCVCVCGYFKGTMGF